MALTYPIGAVGRAFPHLRPGRSSLARLLEPRLLLHNLRWHTGAGHAETGEEALHFRTPSP